MPTRELLVKRKTVLQQHKAGIFNPSLPPGEYSADNIRGARSEQLPKAPGTEDIFGFIIASVWIILWAGIGESLCAGSSEAVLRWRVAFSAENGKILVLILGNSSFPHHSIERR